MELDVGIAWTTHIWTGAVSFAALTGLLLTYAICPHSGGVMRRAVTSLAASLVWFVLLSSAARAHEGHNDPGASDILPPAMFVSGLVVLGAGLSVDRREDVEALYSDIGVFVGVGGLLLAIGLFLF